MHSIKFFFLNFFIITTVSLPQEAQIPIERATYTMNDLGINYLPTIRNISQNRLCPAKEHPKYKSNPLYHDNLTALYGEHIAAAYSVPHLINFINYEVGYGVFALDSIEANQMIGEYTGVVCTNKQMTDHECAL